MRTSFNIGTIILFFLTMNLNAQDLINPPKLSQNFNDFNK